MARNFTQVATEDVKKLGEREEYVRFEKGPQAVEIVDLEIAECDAPNETWLKVNYVLAPIGVASVESEKKIRDDGSEAKYYTAKDAEGNVLPTAKHMVFIPMGTVFYLGRSGKKTPFLWQTSLKFLTVTGCKIDGIESLGTYFAEDEDAVAYFVGKQFTAEFGHRGKYIAEDGDVWRIFDEDENPIKFANPDVVNEFTSDKKAKAAARVNKIKVDEYAKYLNVLEVSPCDEPAEGGQEETHEPDAVDDFTEAVAAAEKEAEEVKPKPKPNPKPKKKPAPKKAKPAVVAEEEFDLEIDETTESEDGDDSDWQ